MKRFAVQKGLLILLLLEDIVDWVLFTLGTSCIYQSRLGQVVELQNTHIVFFKSPCDVMQVRTLSAQLILRSAPVDWCWDATSVAYGHLLTDLSSRAYDRLHYCTNTGSIQSFFCPWTLEAFKDYGWWTHNIAILSKCSNHFRKSAKVFAFCVYPKKFVRFVCDCLRNLLKGSLQTLKNIMLQNFKTKFDYRLYNEQLGSREETFWRPKKIYSSHS